MKAFLADLAFRNLSVGFLLGTAGVLLIQGV
jgi:hypothetical protein